MTKRINNPPKIVLMSDAGDGEAVWFLSRNPKDKRRLRFNQAMDFPTTEAAWDAVHQLYEMGEGDWIVIAAQTEEEALTSYRKADHMRVA